jgi:AcrR family transcriptional regulator
MSGSGARYHHGNLREALIEEAHAILGEDGLEGLSLRRLAARAGVSRSAPYHHFANREALVAAVVRDGFDKLEDRMARGATAAGPDALDQLEAIGLAYVAFSLEHPALYRLMFGDKMHDPDAHPATVVAADNCMNRLVDTVRRGQAQGTIAGREPTIVALAAWSLTHGMAALLSEKFRMQDGEPVEAPTHLDLPGPDALVRHILHTVSHGFRPRADPSPEDAGGA